MRGFKDIKVIKPPKDVKSITPEEFVPEYGRVYIKFEKPKAASSALTQICGRFFNNRLLLGSYLDDSLF